MTLQPMEVRTVSGFERKTKGVVEAITEQSEIVSEYDQEIPQSQTADNPVAP